MSPARIVLSTAAVACALLSAPVSVMAQSGPDLSGAWAPYRGGRGADPAIAPPPAGPIVLRSPYAEEWAAWQAAGEEAVARGEPLPTPAYFCLPYGMPTMMSVAIYPIEIIQRPDQVTIVTEAFSEVRRIYLDRPQAEMDAVPPGYYGRSVGRWEGDTLVVDTIGIRESVRYQGIPHSDQMRITERMRLVTPDILHDEITIEDPIVLEAPIRYTLAYTRLGGYEMVEFVCENNREYIDERGTVRLQLGND
jgi:hypothetical protein